jgi:hypothetical protein
LEQRSHLFLSHFSSDPECLIGFNNVILGILKAIPPSDSAKSSAFVKSQMAYSLYDGRYKAGSPRTSVAPPVQLFHPAFGHFLDDLKKEDAIPDDIVRKTTEYMKAASAIYPDEDKRRSELNPILSDVLSVYIQAIVNSDKTRPDGIVEFLIVNVGPAAIMLEEDKNENGDGGSDSSTQVCFTFGRSWADPKVFFLRVSPRPPPHNSSLVCYRSKCHLLSHIPRRDCGPMDRGTRGGNH